MKAQIQHGNAEIIRSDVQNDRKFVRIDSEQTGPSARLRFDFFYLAHNVQIKKCIRNFTDSDKTQICFR